jgi:hypothetical protein
LPYAPNKALAVAIKSKLELLKDKGYISNIEVTNYHVKFIYSPDLKSEVLVDVSYTIKSLSSRLCKIFVLKDELKVKYAKKILSHLLIKG